MSERDKLVKQTVRLYWRHLSRHPKLVAGVVLTMPFNILVNNFLPPLIVASVLQKLSNGDFVAGEVWQSFGTILITYAALLIFGTSGWRVVDYFMWRLEARVTRSLSQAVFSHLLNMSADFHANSFGGSLVSQTNKFVSSYVRISETTVYGIMPLLWGLVFTSAFLISRAPIFVLAFWVLTVVYVLVTIYVTRPTRRQAAKFAQADSKQTGYLADAVTNVLAVKSFAGKDHEDSRFARVTKETQNALMKLAHMMQIQMNYFSFMTRSFQIVALVTAVISVLVFKANIATVFLVLSFTSLISEQLFNFSTNSIRNYNRAFGDAREMTEILGLTPEILDPEHPAKPQIDRGEIAFNDVAFTHTGTSDALFENLDIKIQPGEKIGLVGHSGSGKTTFTRLLLRFSDVDSGSITIDGQDIRDITQDALHQHIAYVPQEPLMFHRSLTDNIRYGNFRADQKEVLAVSKMAHADDFIQELPQGYDTLVGERGVKLSGGQRQRVAIARAMIKNAPILVLDEATSALDSESELLIQDALWKLMEGRTAIVIAHRLSTIQKMDRIVVMEEGKIVEEGTHKELITQNGTYAELWKHQSGGFLED